MSLALSVNHFVCFVCDLSLSCVPCFVLSVACPCCVVVLCLFLCFFFFLSVFSCSVVVFRLCCFPFFTNRSAIYDRKST